MLDGVMLAPESLLDRCSMRDALLCPFEEQGFTFVVGQSPVDVRASRVSISQSRPR